MSRVAFRLRPRRTVFFSLVAVDQQPGASSDISSRYILRAQPRSIPTAGLLPPPSLHSQAEVAAFSHQDRVRHPEEEPCPYHPRDGAELTLQPGRLRNRSNLAIQDVVAVIRRQRMVAV